MSDSSVDLKKILYDLVDKYFGWTGARIVKLIKWRIELLAKVLFWIANMFKQSK